MVASSPAKAGAQELPAAAVFLLDWTPAFAGER